MARGLPRVISKIGVEGLLVEELRVAGDHGEAVLDVLGALGAVQGPQRGEVGDSLAQRLERGLLDERAQALVAAKEHGEDEARIHVEIGQNPQCGQYKSGRISCASSMMRVGRRPSCSEQAS